MIGASNCFLNLTQSRTQWIITEMQCPLRPGESSYKNLHYHSVHMISLSNFCMKFLTYACIHLSVCLLEEMGASYCLERIRRIQLQKLALPGAILNCGLPEYTHEHSFYSIICGIFLTQARIYLSVCALEDMGIPNYLGKPRPKDHHRTVIPTSIPTVQLQGLALPNT